MMAALSRLTTEYATRGNHEQGLQHARTWVELDPYQEPAQRALVRMLAITGHRADALAQYEACRQLLAEDLGFEPEAATADLCLAIRDGKLGDAVISPATPSGTTSPLGFLSDTAVVEADRPAFVGRQHELNRLHAHPQKALEGQQQVVFVVGGAGRGKTVLLEEFGRQVLDTYPVVVTTGYCNAYSGGGDPTLPFRHVLAMLTGDVKDPWAAGRITREQAVRLWEMLPLAAQAIIEVGPDLIETFLDGTALLERATAAVGRGTSWLSRLGRLVDARTTSQQRADLKQHALIDQYARVLDHVARHMPLIIILEDLHWADRGSIDLTLHVGRQLAHSRILMLGAFHPDEVAAGRDGDRHPLAGVVDELGGLYGDIVLDLAREDPAESRQFVDDLLDVEPNRLDEAFRQAMHNRTRGHPLFTVEMLRMLQEQGDLVQDSEGHWVESPVLAWDRVPARVEAVIQSASVA